MSERSKGDTSSSTLDAPQTSARVVNNPLLSASVTGLTFDDFQNKPLLLPAAPPVIHPIVPVVSSRETAPLVTVGKSSEIDSENLSEVNLNDTSGTTSNSADNSDENSNSLLEPTTQSNQTDSSLFGQAASSFSQLPSVASTVFSTFSKKFNSSSAIRDDINSNLNSQLDIQPFTNQYGSQAPQSVQPPPLYGFQEQKQDSHTSDGLQQPVNLPTFFSPSDIPSAPSAVPGPPSSAAGQNTYRITARKKAYAPIPGLSWTHQEQAPPPVLTSFPPQVDFEPTAYQQYSDEPPAKPEERKGGLFSLSNLVPAVPSVLQNLSGLVQSATGSLTQRQSESTQVNAVDEPQTSYDHWQNPNSFGSQPSFSHSTPQPVNFFAPPSAPPLTAEPTAHVQVGTENYFNPLQSTVPPTVTGHPQSQPPSVQPSGQDQSIIFNPLPNAPPIASTQTPSIKPLDQPGVVHFFTPTLSKGEAESTGKTPPPPSVQTFVPPPAEPSTILTSFPPVSGLFTPPVVTRPPPSEPTSEGPINFFVTSTTPAGEPQTQGVPPPPLSKSPDIASQLPPAADKPPSISQGSTSFRLQKGTRLYKNPFGTTPDHRKSPLTYSSIPEPTVPLNQGNFNVFNPFLPPQQSPIPLVTEKDLSSTVLLTPPVTSDRPFENPIPISKAEETPITTRLPSPPLQEIERTTPKEQVPQPPPQSSTIKSIYSPEKELHDEAKSLNLLQSSLPEQLDFSQPTNLPPHPTVTSEPATASREAANFPPPPPQHIFPNKPNSNPYRKGLLPQHPQPAVPSSISTIFTPNEQDSNLFQSIEPEPINSVIPGPPSITLFFGQDSATAHASVEPEPTSTVSITPAEPPAAISATDGKSLSSTIFSPTIPTAADPSLPGQFFPDSLPPRPAPVAASNPVNFFQQDPLSIDQIPSSTPALTDQFDLQDNSKPHSPAASVPATSAKIATPFDSKENPNPQQPVPNLLSNFFGQSAPVVGITAPVNPPPLLPDATSFFDSFSSIPSVGVDAPPPEDPNSQRIQNFFNNPPPKDPDPVGDLNYNLVGSGLTVRNLQPRSLTPASNLAEPPSSSCSEFSELNSSLSAVNRQPRVSADNSTKVSPDEEAIFENPDNLDLPDEIINELKMSNNAPEPAIMVYKPAVKHWFYKKKLDIKNVWNPFSHFDSALLEEALLSGDEKRNLVAVEGGRYDVNISDRTKAPVYWEGEPIEVRRCSWFYKASDSKYVPYEEEIADILEEEYKKASETGEWHKKIPISATDLVVFHGPTVIVHFQQHQQVDSWGGSTQTSSRPRVVKRDIEDFTIEEGESHKVDHLLFMVHGIGSACDLKMRSVEEVVDEFRSIALQLVQSHYKNSVEHGYVGRVEVLPVSWHGELHSDELGIDEKLKSITLESIPKLRNFTNDTLLDILFYTSPMFCQRIMNTVTASMNSIFIKYKQRHPDFHGGASLAGHSLGSLILFDLLCHQKPLKEREEQNLENPDSISSDFLVDSNQLLEEVGKHVRYTMGPAGTGQPFISYPQLLFQPKKFFALGSPIGMFVTIRGIDKLGLDFCLPTCPGFYNIFHPYDPVAYRLEALVNPDMSGIPPVLIPHHKGRKRMHLELKETMTRVGADLKQRFFETFKTTFDSVGFLSLKSRNDPKEMEKEVEKVLELQSQQDQHGGQGPSTSRPRADSNSTNQSDGDIIEIDFPLGKLNDSKRVDYVLQEAPLEFFNEYLFALSSHVCYWESEDTILFVMKEIYSGIGISPDSQVPQQTMTIERPSSTGSATQSPTS